MGGVVVVVVAMEADRDNLVSSCDAVADELKISDLVGDVWWVVVVVVVVAVVGSNP